MVRVALTAVVLAGLIHTWLPAQSSALWSAVEARVPGTESRDDVIARAQVWSPAPVAAMDIKAGPASAAAFPFKAIVHCDYLPKDMSGASPKFACRVGDEDELKVKFGGTNAEVVAEVAATRLLWALGFPADHMYPVRVICRGCPEDFAGLPRPGGQALFDPASVERKLPGREFDDKGWHWRELEAVREDRGGAPRAHRDALKLLAVFLQHTDTKPQQQRLLCLDDAGADATTTSCRRPVMMLNDLGLTFGRANTFNVNDMAMNLVEWSATPVWKDATGCVGNLTKSFTGTLEDPVISESGRAFLANLLMQLSDTQIRAIFETSRVELRLRDPRKARSGFSTVDDWVAAFKQKRTEIVERRCA